MNKSIQTKKDPSRELSLLCHAQSEGKVFEEGFPWKFGKPVYEPEEVKLSESGEDVLTEEQQYSLEATFRSMMRENHPTPEQIEIDRREAIIEKLRDIVRKCKYAKGCYSVHQSTYDSKCVICPANATNGYGYHSNISEEFQCKLGDELFCKPLEKNQMDYELTG